MIIQSPIEIPGGAFGRETSTKQAVKSQNVRGSASGANSGPDLFQKNQIGPGHDGPTSVGDTSQKSQNESRAPLVLCTSKTPENQKSNRS